MRPRVAIVHDYLTQRGGAERVVLSLARGFPDAAIHTSLFDPHGTFAEFSGLDVRTGPLDRSKRLRDDHRLALPLLAPAFSRQRVDADVVVCSTSGWAHGVTTGGRKLVYCHAPARWLYQSDRYLGARGPAARLALGGLSPFLRRWDRRAAASADRYLANSSATRQLVADVYGIEAEFVPPPYALGPGEEVPVDGLDDGFLLCVCRLLPYKNVGAVAEAFASLPELRLAVVGDGPDRDRLAQSAPANVRYLGELHDAQLRWLYSRCRGLVTAAYEDFGLTPLEAAAFGRPTAALRFGGFLDTIVPGETGVLFDRPEPALIGAGVRELVATDWDDHRLRAQAESFSEARFTATMQSCVDELAAR
jgi:glycosyltransferase involved in cell wall biosynthesis